MLRITLSLLFAASLAAQPRPIVIVPPGPTSATPIVADLYVTCDPLSHTIERVGNVFKIHLTPGPFEALCDPPIPVRYTVALGAVAAGEYRIDVTVGERDSVDSMTFVVRNAEPAAFEIHPFAVRTQPFGLKLRLDARDLGVSKIFVDDVQIDTASVTYDGAYWFPAPAHEQGVASVKIETSTGAAHTVPAALYYFDPFGTPPDPSVFERILFPVLFESAGSHGSQWVSEAAIANPRPWYVDTYNEVFSFVCLAYPCGERLSPDSYIAFPGADYPNGVALLAPREEAADLAFSLRVRDTSRASEGYGTQVPVVREKDMFRNTDLTLLDIPIDPLYRTKVRIYALDTGAHEAEVTVHRQSAPDVVAARYFVPMRRECAPGECPAIPWYGELDLPFHEADGRVNVYVTVGHSEALTWTFASITNNETQQVTIVTADGEGGRP